MLSFKILYWIEMLRFCEAFEYCLIQWWAFESKKLRTPGLNVLCGDLQVLGSVLIAALTCYEDETIRVQ